MRIHAEFEMGPYGKSKLRCQKCGQGILQHCKLKANGAVDTYCRRGTVGVHGSATIKGWFANKISDWYIRGTEPLGSRPGRYESAVNLQ